METFELIKGDSSDIWEFSSKQVDVLDDSWEGSWVVSETLGGEPVIEGDLIKNIDIFNDDSLIGEDYKKSYKLFEAEDGEVLEFNADVIDSTDTHLLTVQGRIINTSGDPVPDRYAYITIKGVFVNASRELRVKTDANGEFSAVFDLSKTVKTPANSFFIFQILPLQSEQLTESSYVVSVEVRQKNTSDELIFRKEVMQSKIKMKAEGVLNTTPAAPVAP
jgi:hypothetical protein